VEEEYESGTYATTTYQYDEISNLLLFTDAENHTTYYSYESLFGLTKTLYPDSEYEMYSYDNYGNIISFTDCNKNTIYYTYDIIYRLTEIQYEDESTVSYTYDLNSNRIRMDDDAPSTGDYVEYTYDQWNRLLTETRYISHDSYPVTYQYDVASRVTQMTYPDSMQILYTYDDLDRMTEIRRYVDGQNDEIIFDNPQYDVEDFLTQFNYGNGLQAFYTFDSRDRLSTIDIKDGSTSLLDLDYTYDNNGNISQIENGWMDINSTWHTETESYSYDGLDRLTLASCTSWSHTYSYDKAGNRTAKDSIYYTINSVNEVTALSDNTIFNYDSNGNRIQKTKGDDSWSYTYDYANRLTKVEKNQSIIGEYIYDGDGKRLQKTENATTTTYIYSSINTIYEENLTGSASYIFGPTGLIAKRTTIDQESNTYYYHKDHLGSVRIVTDSNRNIVSASTYHPFGERDSEGESEHFLFNGEEWDSTDLYYYGGRYYDPMIGRFLTRDILPGKIINPRSLNRYTYCLNNPINYKDFWGLSDYPDEIDPNDFEFLGEPGDSIFWGGEWYILLTPLIRKKGSRVAVAIAYRRKLDHSPHRIYGREEGILIVIYNDNGEIIDVLFFPFDKLDSERGRRKAWREMCDALRRHNIDYNDLSEALNVLFWLMNDNNRKNFRIGGMFNIVGGLAFITFCSLLGGLMIALGICLYIDGEIWFNWSEITLLLSQGHKYYK
jgi:RHS repeat-associated protein